MSFRVTPITWQSPQAEDARRIRFSVFVDEQQVPQELELDEFDAEAIHVLAFDKDNTPRGTARMFTDPEHPRSAKIGRMAVLPSARGKGCGAAMLQQLITIARDKGYREAVLTAQTHAIPFYEKFGFIAEGDEFLDAGIPHFTMRLKF